MIKQSKHQITGRVGESWFESILPASWIFEKPKTDIGLDGRVFLGTDESVGELEFAVQIKTTNNLKRQGKHFIFTGIKSDTFKFWATRVYPTFLIVYDNKNKKGYYVILSSSLNSLTDLQEKKKSVVIKFPVASELSKDNAMILANKTLEYYVKMNDELRKVRFEKNYVPLIHSISKCIRHLFISERASHDNNIDDNKKFDVYGLAISTHTEVLASLDKFMTTCNVDPNSNELMPDFKRFYHAKLLEVIPNIDNPTLVNGITLYQADEKKFLPSLKMFQEYLLEFLVILTRERPTQK